jgi:adenylosuccinate lyase
MEKERGGKMIKRYSNPAIEQIWCDENKLELWQRTELAVLAAKATLGQIDRGVSYRISRILRSKPINLEEWYARERENHHDLNAFLEERTRHLPADLAPYFHGEEELTSYDVEEPAFSRMLIQSVVLVEKALERILEIIKGLAWKYQHTVMMGRTHGQEAVLQTFGKRCLTWLVVLKIDLEQLAFVRKSLKHSKISGAIGNYGSIDPEVERVTLKMLGLKPFYGATQIMPREIFDPLADALCRIVKTLAKIALDIRLSARSGIPICQEPFAKKQKGSSAMPHKKNTISTEKVTGMARLALAYRLAIFENVETWEERAIEQSSVERVAWPDLFHVVLHALDTMSKVLSSLKVHPDNMLREVINSRGCYASVEVKKFLMKAGARYGLAREEAYRIVQLAAFNVFKSGSASELCSRDPLVYADMLVAGTSSLPDRKTSSIKEIILNGSLEVSEELEASEEDVRTWNATLSLIFSDSGQNVLDFERLFKPSYLLRNEEFLFKKMLGE